MRSGLLCYCLVMGGCVTNFVSPGGLSYQGPDQGIGVQLDSAWWHDVGVSTVCGTGQDLEHLHEQLMIVAMPGMLSCVQPSGLCWGLSWTDIHVSEVALVGGRVPGTAHEMWHQILQTTTGDQDILHTGPCWHLVDGDRGG